MRSKISFTFILFAFVIQCFGQKPSIVVMETTLGRITCEIDTMNAPVTAHNFLNHIHNGTFESAIFYRVVRPDNQPYSKTKIEVIQGGLFSDEKIEKHTPIIHETTLLTGLKHLDGTISMARNEPGTASTEFFICIGDQPELNFGGKRNPDEQGFAAFGKVVDGMEVVLKIQQQKDTSQYLVEPVRILKMILK